MLRRSLTKAITSVGDITKNGVRDAANSNGSSSGRITNMARHMWTKAHGNQPEGSVTADSGTQDSHQRRMLEKTEKVDKNIEETLKAFQDSMSGRRIGANFDDAWKPVEMLSEKHPELALNHLNALGKIAPDQVEMRLQELQAKDPDWVSSLVDRASKKLGEQARKKLKDQWSQIENQERDQKALFEKYLGNLRSYGSSGHAETSDAGVD